MLCICFERKYVATIAIQHLVFFGFFYIDRALTLLLKINTAKNEKFFDYLFFKNMLNTLIIDSIYDQFASFEQ